MDGEDPSISYEIIEENVEKLSKKVQKTNPSIYTFLSEPYCLPAFRDSPPGIKEYTNKHLLELLSLSLSPDLDKKTIRAFFHFCFNNNPSSFKPILENGFFSNVSEVIIQNSLHKLNEFKENQSEKYFLDDVSNSVLGRIATTTFNSFYNCPKESINCITFLNELLNFCYITSVCSLFEKLLSNNPKFVEIQTWLVQHVKIHEKIAEIIEKSTRNQENDFSQNVISLYKLISYGLVLPTTSEYFCSDVCTKVIIEKVPDEIQHVRDARWYSIVCLCKLSTSAKLLPLINDALGILIRPRSKLTNEIVNCISFISLMLKYSPYQTAKIILNPSYQIFSVLMGIILRFSSASILHFSFRCFVMSCVKNKLLMPQVIKSYVPFFMAEIHNRNDSNKSLNNLSSPSKNELTEFFSCDETVKRRNSLSSPSRSIENFVSHQRLKDSSQNGLFYATCWNLLIRIDDISNFSSTLLKNNAKVVKSSSLALSKGSISSSPGGNKRRNSFFSPKSKLKTDSIQSQNSDSKVNSNDKNAKPQNCDDSKNQSDFNNDQQHNPLTQDENSPLTQDENNSKAQDENNSKAQDVNNLKAQDVNNLKAQDENNPKSKNENNSEAEGGCNEKAQSNSKNEFELTAVKDTEIQNELSKIVGFDLFAVNELQSYLKIIDGSYGGPISKTTKEVSLVSYFNQ